MPKSEQLRAGEFIAPQKWERADMGYLCMSNSGLVKLELTVVRVPLTMNGSRSGKRARSRVILWESCEAGLRYLVQQI